MEGGLIFTPEKLQCPLRMDSTFFAFQGQTFEGLEAGLHFYLKGQIQASNDTVHKGFVQSASTIHIRKTLTFNSLDVGSLAATIQPSHL